MKKVKSELTGEPIMRHETCSCGRAPAVFSNGEDAHCIHCMWSKTGRSRTSSNYSRATHGVCRGCGKTLALYDTRKGKRCHWCRQKIRIENAVEEQDDEEEEGGPEMANLTCDYCGKEFERKASQVRSQKKKGQDKFYCGQDCFHKDRQLATVG